ncbi:MAG: MarR family transcriptional regulator [Desulfatitalea sp.]
MSNNLTPTAQAILDSLREHPATTTDLRDQTGRSRSTIDKALTDLTKAGLVTKTDPGDDGPACWVLNQPDAAADSDSSPASHEPEHPGNDTHPSDHHADDQQDAAAGPDTASEEPGPAQPAPKGQDTSGETKEDTDDAVTGPPTDAQPRDGEPGQEAPSSEEEVKVCRGCGEQMPKTCPSCGSKTTAYCGTCRKTHPATRRGTPGEPQILANGLPKLLPGQLERLVADVIRSQPLPDHLGITGWTSGRVAIFLPGRSTGAIGNALDKLATTGQAQLLGDNPKRYQPTPDPEPPHNGEHDDPGDIDRHQ